MKNILDSRKIIDTENQESLLKQIEAKVKDNNVPVLEDLLENLASLDNSLLNQVSEIWDLAVEPGRVEALEVLLENTEFKKNINVTNNTGLTPIMRAAKLDNASAVRKLLVAGAEYKILPVISSEKTVLHYAIESGKARVLKVLINSKLMSLEILNELLMLAVLKNNSDAIKVLLKAGADITIQTAGNPYKWDGTILHMAVSSDKIEILDLLLKHQDINQVLNLLDGGKYTPLMYAAFLGHEDAVKKLIRAGADITIRIKENPYGWNGATALHIAAEVSIIEVLELLLGHRDIKKILDLPGGDGYTALMGAAYRGRKDAVSRLIEAGADVTIQVIGNSEWNGYTALHMAVYYNKIEILELLLKHKDTKKVLNLPKEDGYTPLMDAASKGHADAVSKLIEAGVDITAQITGNFKGRNGSTALHMVVYYNKIEILELLLKHKDIKKVLNLPKEDGFTPLMKAAHAGHADAVSKLIEAGADITIQVTGNSDGWGGYTALHIAASLNKIEVLELLFKYKDIREVLNLPDKDGCTPLIDAASKGHADAVSKLIEAGVDITAQITGNSKGLDGVTALHIAASLNKIGILELLLKHQDIREVLNLPDKYGFTPLIDAAFKGHADAVSKLIEAGADITSQIAGSCSDGWDGATALHIAVFYNKIEVLKLLLKHQDIKKILNLPKEDGYTPLMSAAKKGYTDTVGKLIEAGADITAQITGNPNGWDGATALHIAVSLNKIEVLELLLKHEDTKKILNLPDKDGFTPLMDAARGGHADAVGKLIEAGADITAQITGNSDGWDGATALHIAVLYNEIEVLELLLKHQDIREVLNLPDKDGFTPLMDAARGGYTDTVSRLIEAGADITIQVTGNSDGWDRPTALHIAVLYNEIEVLELLLKHQDIREVLNLPDKDGFTPLMDAARGGHADAVSMLIEAGADITAQTTGNSKGLDGATALYIAASLNKIEVLELLLKHKDIREVLNLPNEDGYTPLMGAAHEGHADAVSKLIEVGADITIQVTGNSDGWDGYTALHIAASENRIEVLKELLKHKDIKKVLNLPNKNGFTPLVCAAIEGHTDTVSRLIEAGADITMRIAGNSKGWDGATALYITVSLNKIEVLELLLKHKDIKKVLNLPIEDGYTPLMDAAFKGYTDTVSRLIEAGADITIQVTGNSDGWDRPTALHIAASENRIEVLKELLKHQDIREVLNLPDKNGFTPLMRAASKGHSDVVSRLIEAGADITMRTAGNSKGWNGATALYIAVSLNKIEVLELLLKHKDIKKVLNLPNKNGYTPLMDAAFKGYTDTASRLIEAGADITIQVTGNSDGWDRPTALHIAASENRIEVLKELLKHQDIREVLNLPDKNGFTPLMNAASFGYSDAVSKLIEAGADITVQITGNSDVWGGYTALHIAVYYNKIEILELLLKHQDIKKVLNLQGKNDLTPLMRAAIGGHVDAVSRLIEAGADITVQITGNSKGLDGLTALHMAVPLNKIEVLELLFKHKDIREVLNLPDKDGFTPLMDAAIEGHVDVVSKLIEAGADVTIQVTGNSEWNGYTALHMAVYYNKIEILELLLKHKDVNRVVNIRDKDGCTPLMRAISNGYEDAVSRLEKYDINTETVVIRKRSF